MLEALPSCINDLKLHRYSVEKLSFSYVIPPGVLHQGCGNMDEALSGYINAIFLDQSFVPSKILLGDVLSKNGSKALPVSRSLLSDALRIDPTNAMAWFYLGVIHRDDGRIADAADCFQAAAMLEESDPIENFSSLL